MDRLPCQCIFRKSLRMVFLISPRNSICQMNLFVLFTAYYSIYFIQLSLVYWSLFPTDKFSLTKINCHRNFGHTQQTLLIITKLAHLCHRHLTMKLRHRIEFTRAYFSATNLYTLNLSKKNCPWKRGLIFFSLHFIWVDNCFFTFPYSFNVGVSFYFDSIFLIKLACSECVQD